MRDKDSLSCRKAVITELNQAFKGIVHNHKYLNKQFKEGEEIIGSGEWLLDNIYLIEKEYKAIKFNLPASYFDNLPYEANSGSGCPRIYELAKSYVKINQGIIKEDEIIKFINEQEIDFTMGELWAFPLMIRIALIINLAKVTNDMIIVQKQRSGARKLANTVLDSYNQGKIDSLLTKLNQEYPLNKVIEKQEDIEEYMGILKICMMVYFQLNL